MMTTNFDYLLSSAFVYFALLSILASMQENLSSGNQTRQVSNWLEQNEPRCEKTGLWGFRPGLTQTRQYNHRRWLEA